MKRRPSSSFLVCSAVAIVLGGIGFWFLTKLKAFPLQQWRNLSFSEILSGEKYDPSRRTPEQIAAARKQIAELKQKMVAEFPPIAIRDNSIADERNGFLQLYLLGEDMEKRRVLVTPGLREQLEPAYPWDPAAMRAALVENSELVARIESIAALPDRSSTNMPESYAGYFATVEVKRCADILMAKARLAAEAKDEAEALRLTTATLNLASHLDQTESPTFLASTVGLLIDLHANESVIARLLPALGRDADLMKWRAALATRPDYTPDGYARILRGEWSHMISQSLPPLVLSPQSDGNPGDTEAFVRAFTERYDFMIRNLMGQKPSALLSMPRPPASATQLSKESRELLDIVTGSSTEWNKGYARAACIRARTLAALDLLTLEKSGITLTADSVSKVTLDPLSGQSFLYDPATRALTAPPTLAASVNVKPLVLPR